MFDGSTEASRESSARDDESDGTSFPRARNDLWRSRHCREQTREEERMHLRTRSRRTDELHSLAEMVKQVSDVQALRHKIKDVLLGSHRRGWPVGTGSATNSRRLRIIERSCRLVPRETISSDWHVTTRAVRKSSQPRSVLEMTKS